MGLKLAVYGASGLTGLELVKQALNHPDVEVVYSIGRKQLMLQSSKLVQLVSQGQQLIDEIELPIVDTIVCCLGTTIKKAGSQDAFREVDVNLPVRIARRAKNNHVRTFIVQSSIGAGPGASGFYLKCKTEMEEALIRMNYQSTYIFRPSLLLGNRQEFRFGEQVAAVLLKLIKPLLFGGLKKYRAIATYDVARVMLKCAMEDSAGLVILESDEIQTISKTV